MEKAAAKNTKLSQPRNTKHTKNTKSTKRRIQCPNRLQWLK